MAQPVNKRRLFFIVLIGLIAIAGISFWSGPAIEIPDFELPSIQPAIDWLTQLWPDNPFAPEKPAAQVVAPAKAPPPPSPVASPAPSQAPPPALKPAQPSQPGQPAQPAQKPVLPTGSSVAVQTIRDPFAPPPEASVIAARLADPTAPASTSPQAGVPKLTGVIQGGGSKVVILRFGNISRSYREGESAGPYKIESIGAYSVTLSGPNGNVVLTMGQ